MSGITRGGNYIVQGTASDTELKKPAPQEIIAQVGGHKPPTTGDVCRVMFAAEQCGALWPKNVVHSDVINLLYDRDFLTEDRTYDVVLVHSIFHTNADDKLYEHISSVRNAVGAGGPLVSPQHSVWQWARRLVSTKARLICVCETIQSSLSGWQLGELAGYKIYKRDANITIYVREVPC